MEPVVGFLAREQKPVGLRLDGLPVGAKQFKQTRGQHDVAVFLTLSEPDVDHHPAAVDVGNPQVHHLGGAQASGVRGHQDCPVLDVGDGFEEPRNLGETQRDGEFPFRLGAGNVIDGPVLVKGRPIEKTNCADRLVQVTPRQALLIHQVKLVGTDLLGTEQLRRLAEVLGELRDLGNVGFLGPGREVAHPHVLDHPLPQGCHGRLLS